MTIRGMMYLPLDEKAQMSTIELSETRSIKTVSALDVPIDDGVDTDFPYRFFSFRLSTLAIQLRPSFPIGFGAIGGRYLISVPASYRR